MDKVNGNNHIYTFDRNKIQYYLNVFKNNAEVNEKKRINELSELFDLKEFAKDRR